MSDQQKRLSELENFLIDNEADSKDEAVSELRSNGVNVSAFFSRVQKTVDAGYSKQLQRLAADQQSEHRAKPSFLSNLADMTRDSMLKCFQRLRSGEFGVQYKEAALARCRNKDATELTDEELRSWLDDVGDIIGEPEQ